MEDRRGYGRSSPPSGGGWSWHGEDAVVVIEELGLSPASVVGWSGGGYVAIHLAVERPQLVRNLVLAETGLPLPPVATASYLLMFLREQIIGRLRGRRAAAEAFLRWVLSENGSTTVDREDYPEERKQLAVGNADGMWTDIDPRGRPDLSRKRLEKVSARSRCWLATWASAGFASRPMRWSRCSPTRAWRRSRVQAKGWSRTTPRWRLPARGALRSPHRPGDRNLFPSMVLQSVMARRRSPAGARSTLVLAALALLALAWLGPGIAQATFPGENGKIAFERDGRIWVMNADGSAPRALTCRGGVVPAWSPDGRRIAFERGTGTDIGSHIWTIRSDGSGEALLAKGGAPAWSPDGRRIAFNTPLTRLGWTQLGVMSADGSGSTLFPANGGMGPSSSPDWSPDGGRIAFASGHEIWVMNAEGGDKASLPDTWPAASPDWSPDGERIAFQRMSREVEEPPPIFEIWVMDAEGGGQVRLTTRGSAPTWSPDGERIAFERDGDIWAMNVGGTQQTRLTDSPARDRAPDWQRRPAPPADPPLRQFCFGAVRRNTNRGIARLVVEVPRPGRVVLQRQPGVKRFAQVHPGAGPGRVILRVRPRGWAQRLLSQAGRALHRVQLPVRAQVTYRPRVGEPVTKGRRVWLVRVAG